MIEIRFFPYCPVLTIYNICIMFYHQVCICLLSVNLFSQVEKQRTDLTRELDDLTDRLEEAGGVTASQVRS